MFVPVLHSNNMATKDNSERQHCCERKSASNNKEQLKRVMFKYCNEFCGMRVHGETVYTLKHA